jgi:hypothetical protein
MTSPRSFTPLDLGIYRITAFCRRYDVAKNRFLPVNDPDYEYAD